MIHFTVQYVPYGAPLSEAKKARRIVYTILLAPACAFHLVAIIPQIKKVIPQYDLKISKKPNMDLKMTSNMRLFKRPQSAGVTITNKNIPLR